MARHQTSTVTRRPAPERYHHAPRWAGGPLCTIHPGPGLSVTVPLTHAVFFSVDIWPDEAFTLQHACGISWDWLDIRRFLSMTGPSSKLGRAHPCQQWRGAKSRGKGNLQWYGSFYTKGKTVRAHKFAGVAILGLRPGPGDELDHECHDTLCISCLEVLTQAQNQARIRRPSKHHLDLARFCDMTPAEIMTLPPDRLAVFTRMMQVTKQINAGQIPKGVILCKPRRQ